jgi:hypothetical protein
MEKARNMALLALLTCTYLVAGRDLNPRPLGYDPTDVRLRCLGQSLVTALTSADRRLEVIPGPLYLSRLSLFRCVRFTNRFTEPALDLRLSALLRTREPAQLLSSGTQRRREHLIGRSVPRVRSKCWNPYPLLSIVPGVRC